MNNDLAVIYNMRNKIVLSKVIAELEVVSR